VEQARQTQSSLLIVFQTSKYFVDHKQNSSVVKLLTTKIKNKSLACNLAIKESDSSLLMFTDDDCEPKKNWLLETKKHFETHRGTSLVFGKVENKKKDQDSFCPSTFSFVNGNGSKLGEPIWQTVGFSNNMAVRKSVFKKIGGFKWWLGPGSFMSTAMDAEFILRCQIAQLSISFNEKSVIYHNRWLNYRQIRIMEARYSAGGIAAHTFYTFQGVMELQPVVKIMISDIGTRIITDLKYSLTRFSFFHAYMAVYESYCLAKGFAAGFVFAKYVPIPEKENVVKRFYKKN